MTGPSGKAVEYETSDAEPRLIAWLAGGTVVFLVLSPLILQLLFPDSVHRSVFVGKLAEVPAPRLQINPEHDLAALRQAEAKRLSGYGWINRERKIVHMPIERAFTLTLERGLPGWSKP
jgi:hypothetical protein